MNNTASNREYWEERYQSEIGSGAGSVGKNREWKWRIINQYLPTVEEVIDVGCGDITFWKDRDCQSYIGIDHSSTIIEKIRKERPNWKFILAGVDETLDISSKVVFCFDLLFHIMDDEIYEKIIHNLCKYSEEWIFVFTWEKNPFSNYDLKKRIASTQSNNLLKKWKLMLLPMTTDGKYQHYRNFKKYFHTFNSYGFKLKGVHSIPYPPSELFPYPIGAMYVFNKSISEIQPN